jgi:hypothetical protein
MSPNDPLHHSPGDRVGQEETTKVQETGDKLMRTLRIGQNWGLKAGVNCVILNALSQLEKAWRSFGIMLGSAQGFN